MRIIFVIFFLITSCGSKDENLVDLNSFVNQGKKVSLIDQENLNDKEVLAINNLKNIKYITYKNWPESNSNSNNNINPVKLNINKIIKNSNQNIVNFVIYNDEIIAIDKKSNLYVFDLDLKKRKLKKIYSRKIYKNYNLTFSIIVKKNRIYISDNIGNVHCLDIKNLNLIWKKSFGVPFMSDIKLNKNNLYIINSNSKIFSLNADNGKINWSYETVSKNIKDFKSYHIAIFDDKLLFTNDSSEIYCLDLKKNNILWSRILQNENFQNLPIIFKSSPITIDQNGIAYVSTNNGFTYSIEIKSGIINWVVPVYSTNRLFVSGNYLLSVQQSNLIILNRLNGKILFNKKISINKKTQLTLKSLFIGERYLYLFGEKGFIVFLDLNDLQKYKVKKFLKKFSNFIILKNNLYVSTSDSIIKFK